MESTSVGYYSGIIRDGVYYIETDNYFPLKGNGWYTRGLLEYCQSESIEFSVKYEIIPSHTLPADYFNEFFDRIYSECDDAKSIVNCFIGYLNKKLKRTTKDRFTADLNDAVRYYFSQDKAMYHPVEECPELYHISIEKEATLDECTVPLYWQIIDNNAIMVHQLSKKLGGKIVKIKTDCVVVENGNQVECKSGIGQYRVERLPIEYKVSPTFENNYFYVLKKNDWNPECTGYNRLLTGRAGTGKSHQMKQDLRHLGRYVLLRTTNNAAKTNE
jgi:hypothetical protein